MLYPAERFGFICVGYFRRAERSTGRVCYVWVYNYVGSRNGEQAMPNQQPSESWWGRMNLFRRVKQLEQKMGNVSTELATVKSQLDAVVAEVPTIAAAVASLQQQIATLQSGSGGSTLTAADQAVLDQAAADAATLQTSVGNLNTSLQPPAPTPPAGG